MKSVYAAFGIVAVAALASMFLAFQGAGSGFFYQPLAETQKECKYQCAVKLHNCRQDAAKSTENCQQSRYMCVKKQQALEQVCNNKYWGCRAKCATQPGAAVAAYR